MKHYICSRRILSEQLDKYRNEYSDLKLKTAKLSSQLTFMNDRFKILQSNTEGYKREIACLEQKNEKYAGIVAKNEQAISVLKEVRSPSDCAFVFIVCTHY